MSTNVPIASITLSAATRSVTFSGIPQTYTDLVMVMTGTNATGGAGSVRFQFNGDNTSVYSSTRLLGNGTSASSTGNLNESSANVGYYSDSIIGNNIVSIMNYSNSTTYKTCLHRSNATDSRAQTGVALWRNTSAITSITVLNGTGNYDFTAGCTFNLYGIASGGPKAFGGDTVTTDGTYYYHTFRSSGTFTPTQALSVDYLVVAGGGGGGDKLAGGGGGAGGLRSTVTATGGGGSIESALSLTASTNYTVTVGAGGAGGASTKGVNGSDSVFGTITSLGGGGGGGWDVLTGSSGGSGGGAEGQNANGGSGTSGQGYAGGYGAAGVSESGGGGGGAGAAGANGVANANAGNGGNGVAVSISGSSVTYAGGGGGAAASSSYSGGTGGTGGGGNGGAGVSENTLPTNGTANLGGGGGGGAGYSTSTQPGGAGGSGIVIVRYPV